MSGTILLGTGIVYALFGVRAKRVHTFFSTALLAALGTTVLILYLMTPPVTNAVQGAFVVAAVCTGAALGGLAVLFQDLAECLGCLLGGLCLSMWLLTVHEGGLIQNTTGKVVFIAVFAFAGFCLYFSRWTRTYGLMACISFSGSTAAVLGIDCFSRAGLKEFWAYIWALNDRLFPDGAVTYPLTRGIRVELAVTVLFFVVGIVSQLKLWRLIQDHRNKKSKDDSTDVEQALPDEEENIGRQIEEMTERERREWERVYGNGGALSPADSAVGDMDGEKPEGRSKRTSTTSATEVQSPGEKQQDGEVPVEAAEGNNGAVGQDIIEKDAADGRITVRVVKDDVPEGAEEAEDGEVNEKGEGEQRESTAPAAATAGPKSGPEPTIVPLPFRIPTERKEGDGPTPAADDDDDSSVAAVADEEEHEPTAQAQAQARNSGAPRNSLGLRRSLSQHSAGASPEQEEAEERYEPPVIPKVKDDSDSVVATWDDESSSGDADTAILDWSQAQGGPSEGVEVERGQEVGAAQKPTVSTDVPAVEGRDDGTESPVMPEPSKAQSASNPSEPVTQTRGSMESKHDNATAHNETPANPRGDKSGSTESLRTMAARLTKSNLPPALPDVALTYRTNEWAKHLSMAEMPEPEILQLAEPVPDEAEEQPAHVDVVELQKTAENAAPPPAAPRSASAMSSYPANPAAARSSVRVSMSGAEMAGLVATAGDAQQGYRPGPYRGSAMMMTRQSSALLAEPIAEEHGEYPEPAGVHSLLAASMSAPDLAAQQYAPQRPQTLIGMREMLLRSRASGIFPIPADAIYSPAADPSSDAASLRNYPAQQQQPVDLDLDDLPLSHRRALIRQQNNNSSSNSSAGSVINLPLPTPAIPQATADTTAFDSHQPRRISTLPTESARQAQLAHFRNSVAADLRRASVASASAPNLLNPTSANQGGLQEANRQGEALRSIELQRGILMGRKEAEARRKEVEREGRERFEREFEERMRSGALMGAHRDAMRRLQGGVKS